MPGTDDEDSECWKLWERKQECIKGESPDSYSNNDKDCKVLSSQSVLFIIEVSVTASSCHTYHLTTPLRETNGTHQLLAFDFVNPVM